MGDEGGKVSCVFWEGGRSFGAKQKVNPVLAWAENLVMVRCYDESISARAQ